MKDFRFYCMLHPILFKCSYSRAFIHKLSIYVYIHIFMLIHKFSPPRVYWRTYSKSGFEFSSTSTRYKLFIWHARRMLHWMGVLSFNVYCYYYYGETFSLVLPAISWWFILLARMRSNKGLATFSIEKYREVYMYIVIHKRKGWVIESWYDNDDATMRLRKPTWQCV